MSGGGRGDRGGDGRGEDGRGDARDDAAKSDFERAMQGVRKLPPDPRRAATPRSRPAPRAPAAGHIGSRGPGGLAGDPSIERYAGATARPIRIDRIGDRIEGLGDGASRRLLKRLRGGEIAADEELDLHGMTSPDAERRVIDAILALHARGGRCLRIVHGKGLRSELGRPVLRDALPGWLSDARVASLLLGVTSAAHAQGDTGATWVYLRRAR